MEVISVEDMLIRHAADIYRTNKYIKIFSLKKNYVNTRPSANTAACSICQIYISMKNVWLSMYGLFYWKQISTNMA